MKFWQNIFVFGLPIVLSVIRCQSFFCSKMAQIEANILWKLILTKSRVDLTEVISVMTLSQFSHDINLKTEHQFLLISQIEISFKLCSQAEAKNCMCESMYLFTEIYFTSLWDPRCFMMQSDTLFVN